MPITEPIEIYGTYLPTPYIEKISVYDEKITCQVSIVLDNIGYGSPTEIVDYMTNNLNFYILWGMSEKTHEHFIDGNINMLSMMSSSAEQYASTRLCFLEDPISGDRTACLDETGFGGAANFVTLDFSDSEPIESWYDSSTLHYKLTTEADIQLVGLNSDGSTLNYHFTDRDPDERFLFTGYIDDYQNFFLYAFSSVVEKDEETFLSSRKETYDQIARDQIVAEYSISDTAYERVFKDGVLFDDPREIWLGDPESPTTIYHDIPIQSLDGFYYAQNNLTFLMIDEALTRFYINSGYGPLVTEEQLELAKLQTPAIASTIDGIKYIHSVYGRKPEILVELNQLRRTWPIKAPGTSMGRAYRAYANMIHRLNSSFIEEDRLYKKLVYNNKIIDQRTTATMDAVSWSELNTSFFGLLNPPTAETRGTVNEDGTIDPPTETYSEWREDIIWDDYVIYNHHYMHRAGVNLNPIEIDDVSDVIESGFEDILNKGYYFIDYERIVNDYLLISRIYYVKAVEGLFGKALTNAIIAEKSLLLTRYDLSEFGVDQPVKEFSVTFDEEYTYPKVQYIVHANYLDTYGSDSPAGHAVLETDYRFSLESDASGYYVEELEGTDNMVYSYVMPRNMDVLSKTNFKDTYDNYRLLCMSYEDYYSWDYAVDVGREKEGGYFQVEGELSTEYYHTIFHIQDHSIAAVLKLIEHFLEVYESFKEYAEYAQEACSYNSVDDSFNSFFVEAMYNKYGEDMTSAPWFLAPLIFNIHREMLFFTFEGSRRDLIDNTIAIMASISPTGGSLEAITALFEAMSAIAELYAGIALDSDESDEEVEVGPIAAIINEWGSEPLDMQFEAILECFPPIIYTAEIVTTLGGDPTIDEPPGRGTDGWDNPPIDGPGGHGGGTLGGPGGGETGPTDGPGGGGGGGGGGFLGGPLHGFGWQTGDEGKTGGELYEFLDLNTPGGGKAGEGDDFEDFDIEDIPP